MKRISIIIALILALAAVFFLYLFFSKKSDDHEKRGNTQRKVDIFVVQPSSLRNELQLSGELSAYDEVMLCNEMAGRIVQIHLPEGQSVKKGTLLVKFFDDDLQAHLRKLQVQCAIQEKIYERQQELLAVNGISQNDFDQTTLQLNSLKADIDVQKALIQKTEVLAPFDGVIGLRNVSTGATIPAATSLATIRTEERLKLDFYIPERYSPEMKQGLKINFTVFEGDKLYNAVVFATERGIDNNTLSLKVRAEVTSKDKELIAGAFVNVRLNLKENNNALIIPTQAIIPEDRDKKVIVARNGKAHFTSVKTGVRQASGVEITEGLVAGDTVVVSGILFLKENAELIYNEE